MAQEWIRLQSREVFSDQEHFLRDFYQDEYLADASESCWAQSPEWGRRRPRKSGSKTGLSKVIEEAAEHIEPLVLPRKRLLVFGFTAT